jgi:hypothetical protein
MIQFSALTVPTPEPYDKQTSTKQFENLCYVLLQVAAQMKANSETLTLNQTANQTVNVDLTELVAAVKDLVFRSYAVDFGCLKLESHGITEGSKYAR